MKKISATKDSLESVKKFAPKVAVKSAEKKVVEAVIVAEPKKNAMAKKVFVLVIAVIVLGFGATAYYFYHKYKTVPSVETEEIAKRIGKFMELPQGETPTLATVTDRDKMKEQPFFAKAENGDKVLIYTKAQKAILYRPSINKIVEVMQLSISKPTDAKAQQTSADSTQATQNQTQAAAPEIDAAIAAKLKVAVYNGSGVKGKAVTVSDEISKLDGLEVTQKTNATGNFEETLVVDLTDENEVIAKKIAEALNAKTGQLPEGETKPDADILVIAGVK